MHTTGRRLLLTALVAALAVVQPTLSFSHALEHLEQARATDAPGEDSQGNHEGGAHCDLCLSLSQGRAALVSKTLLAPVRTPLVARIESAVPLPVPSRALRAPESPRAPPLG